MFKNMISSKNAVLKPILYKFLRPTAIAINPLRLGSGGITKIGRREIVGFGFSGEPVYYDSWDYPFPPCRYREVTPELKALREKEKGDWKALSIEEKKCLYRVSFCQTYAEMLAPTGEWKRIVGGTLIACALGIWLWLFHLLISRNPRGRPPSYREKRQKAQLKRILDLQMNPIEGIASKWDYKNNRWK